MIDLKTPLHSDDVKDLKVGDVITITGTIYTARDQAHRRIVEDGEPFDLDGKVLFHAGPIINKKDDGTYEVVAIGPTTSMRMNPYEADVIDKGVRVVIGKGGMDDNVRQALKDNNAVYVVATGGCAALYVDALREVDSVTWLDLGVPEAMWELKVDSFGPLIVAMDSQGKSLYD
jgi:fumarate hydratase subunit beta